MGRVPVFRRSLPRKEPHHPRLLLDRFAGDGSLCGGVELRWAFAKITVGLPAKVGLTLAANAGRGWLEGEDSDTWHPGFGAGIFFARFKRAARLEIGFGKSDEKTFFVVPGEPDRLWVLNDGARGKGSSE